MGFFSLRPASSQMIEQVTPKTGSLNGQAPAAVTVTNGTSSWNYYSAKAGT